MVDLMTEDGSPEMEKTLKDIKTGFNKTKNKMEMIKDGLYLLEDTLNDLMKAIKEEKLMPYKEYVRKGYIPNYYLIKQSENCIEGIKIPQWLYDFIRKEIKK